MLLPVQSVRVIHPFQEAVSHINSRIVLKNPVHHSSLRQIVFSSCSIFMVIYMISYREACEIILDSVSVLDTEKRETFNCDGQVLASDIYSDYSLPLQVCASQDGYAVRAADTAGFGNNGPVVLRVIGTARAGSVPESIVVPGTAVRIMTGSLLPEGADCVIRLEDTDEPELRKETEDGSDSHIRLTGLARAGDNCVRPGENIIAGTLVAGKGTLIGPHHISVLMAVGRRELEVVRRPVMAVISTGDELVTPGRPLMPDKTYNSNTSAIAALVRQYGGTAKVLGVARDYEISILTKFRKGAAADAVITSGGSSKGDFDLVGTVLEKIGRVKLSHVNMAPGASFTFGIIDKLPNMPQVPLFALSGHPSGCMVDFELFVRPAMLKMRGLRDTGSPFVEAVAEDAFTARKLVDFFRWSVLRKVNGEYRVNLNDEDRPGVLASIARANSLAVIPEGAGVRKGDTVRVFPLKWCSEYQPGLP